MRDPVPQADWAIRAPAAPADGQPRLRRRAPCKKRARNTTYENTGLPARIEAPQSKAEGAKGVVLYSAPAFAEGMKSALRPDVPAISLKGIPAKGLTTLMRGGRPRVRKSFRRAVRKYGRLRYEQHSVAVGQDPVYVAHAQGLEEPSPHGALWRARACPHLFAGRRVIYTVSQSPSRQNIWLGYSRTCTQGGTWWGVSGAPSRRTWSGWPWQRRRHRRSGADRTG